MIIRLAGSVLGVGFVLVAHAVSAGECSGRGSRYTYGADAVGNYATRPGTECTVRVQSGGSLESLVVSSKPSNGTAVAQGSAVSYKPKAGFTGTDEFVYTVTGEGMRGKGTSHVTVSMTVN